MEREGAGLAPLRALGQLREAPGKLWQAPGSSGKLREAPESSGKLRAAAGELQGAPGSPGGRGRFREALGIPAGKQGSGKPWETPGSSGKLREGRGGAAP